MKITSILMLASILLVPTVVHAANVCVWNYDTLDLFYDAQQRDTIDCAYWVQNLLTHQGHNVEVFNRYLPADLSGYDVVFCLMGWYRC
jgi:hypothetical protein